MSNLISRRDVPDTNVGDMISRQKILRAFEEMCSCTDYGWDERDFRDLIKKMPSAEPVKAYTKADYIMALHKEYGCTLTMAEEAHNKALEHLRSKSRMKGRSE